MENVNEISEVTRRNIFDEITASEILWWGRLSEPNFLNRIFDLSTLPSTDQRFKNAAEDIWQHRENNYDWENDWIFHDTRFNLLQSSDESFLKFLCEMVHPIVRSDEEEVLKLIEILNRHLVNDGYEIVESMKISGRPIFFGRKTILNGSAPLKEAKSQFEDQGAEYITSQITRMESAINHDPGLAIGTAKELIETYCKTILTERGITVSDKDDLTKLVKITAKELSLSPSDISDSVKASESIKKVLGNLAAISQGLAELRNAYGTGHGKEATTKGLQPRHAKLAVGAASTLAVFLYETHKLKT